MTIRCDTSTVLCLTAATSGVHCKGDEYVFTLDEIEREFGLAERTDRLHQESTR